MMQRYAVYFGPKQRLFGIFHPSTHTPCREVVLVCTPLLEEGRRAHWVLKEISSKLADSGCSVLRFNFTGHENSLGDIAECNLSRWCDDLRGAAMYLRSISPAGARLSVFAPRFSFALAGMSGIRFDTCCGWDPIVKPSDWLARLRQIRNREQESWPHANLQPDEYAGYDLAKVVVELASDESFLPDAAWLSAVLGPSEPVPDLGLQGLSRTATDYSWEKSLTQMLFLQDVVDASVACFGAAAP